MQEDFVDNFFKFDSIEQVFKIGDCEKNGTFSFFKFNSVLKKRLFSLKDSNFKNFIDIANEGLNPNITEKLEKEKIIIDYKNFLNNLINYREDIREKKIGNLIKKQRLLKKKEKRKKKKEK